MKNTKFRATRSAASAQEYEKKLAGIIRNYGADLVRGGVLDENGLVEVFGRLKKRLSINTVKKYRVVLLDYARRQNVSVDRELFFIKGEEVSRKTNKCKRYPSSARSMIIERIQTSPWRDERAKRWLYLYLQYGVYFGFRLSEYGTVSLLPSIEDGMVVVTVKNGKNSNGRSNGLMRRLTYPSRVGGGDIREFLPELVSLSKDKNVISSARNLHDKIVRAIDSSVYREHVRSSKKLSLTSIRHEFKMHFKEANGDVNTSAAMGHASSKTQKINYGRKGNGGGSLSRNVIQTLKMVEVAQANIDKVRLVETSYKESREKPKIPRLR